MAKFSDKPWDGSASRWDTPEAYCAACLIDDNEPGQAKVKEKCHLPVKDPGGGYNRNGVHAAAGGRGITRLQGVSAEVKRKAANRLISLYAQMGEVAPESVYRIAGKRQPSKSANERRERSEE